MNEQLEELVDVHEAARIFGITPDTVYKYAKAGLIPSVKVGDILRFDRWTLVQWIRNQNQGNQ